MAEALIQVCGRPTGSPPVGLIRLRLSPGRSVAFDLVLTARPTLHKSSAAPPHSDAHRLHLARDTTTTAHLNTCYRRGTDSPTYALWQGDMLVGPYLPDADCPGKYRRAALFCFIDDYSRLVPYGEFFLEESLPRLDRVLKVAILRRGLPQALSVDNGKSLP